MTNHPQGIGTESASFVCFNCGALCHTSHTVSVCTLSAYRGHRFKPHVMNQLPILLQLTTGGQQQIWEKKNGMPADKIQIILHNTDRVSFGTYSKNVRLSQSNVFKPAIYIHTLTHLQMDEAPDLCRSVMKATHRV